MSAKTRTLRGNVIEGVVHRLVVDDGRLTHGFRITKFVVMGDPTSSVNDVFGVLGYQGNFPPPQVNFGDNNQFAWASAESPVTGAMYQAFSLIDPNHIVIRDMYIYGQVGAAGGTSNYNYYIEMEPIEIDENMAVMALIKERGQGELRS